jgi:hypothetical protein
MRPVRSTRRRHGSPSRQDHCVGPPSAQPEPEVGPHKRAVPELYDDLVAGGRLEPVPLPAP